MEKITCLKNIKNIFNTYIYIFIFVNNKKLNKYSDCVNDVNESIKILKNIVFPNGEPENNIEYKNCKQNKIFCELFRKRFECYKKMEKFQEAIDDLKIVKTIEK